MTEFEIVPLYSYERNSRSVVQDKKNHNTRVIITSYWVSNEKLKKINEAVKAILEGSD